MSVITQESCDLVLDCQRWQEGRRKNSKFIIFGTKKEVVWFFKEKNPKKGQKQMVYDMFYQRLYSTLFPLYYCQE